MENSSTDNSNLNVQVILLDIEGTTTSINFVKDVLFVKAREDVRSFLEKNYENEDVQIIIEELKKQVASDVENGVAGVENLVEGVSREEEISVIVRNVLGMMDADRKVKPLKSLQGKIWKRAYEDGQIKGHCYEDVVPTLKKWQKEGKRICIYSSGSVEAQKLLFKHSEEGNLLTYFEKHFDTAVGPKTEPNSYETIAETLGVSPSSILFLTDVESEAFAASSIGVQVVLSIRPGTKPLSEKALETFKTITSFLELTSTEKTKRNISNVEANDNKGKKVKAEET